MDSDSDADSEVPEVDRLVRSTVPTILKSRSVLMNLLYLF